MSMDRPRLPFNTSAMRVRVPMAKQTELNRQGLYAALSADGNPTLETLLRVLAALNLELSVREVAVTPATAAE